MLAFSFKKVDEVLLKKAKLKEYDDDWLFIYQWLI